MSNPEQIRPGSPSFQVGLHRGQLEVVANPARFKVVVCGRQWGKTLLGAALCVKTALEGGTVWWVGPSFPVGELGMQAVNRLCHQIPGAHFERRPIWRTTLPSGGSIQMRSADNPDSLRGATLDGVVFDEAATAKPDAWPTLRPTLSIKNGWATFISTPKGLNWFHDVFEGAGSFEDWARWQKPSVDNPWLPATDVEKARVEMSALMFSQEYLAEFISYSSGIFRSDWFVHYQEHKQDGENVYRLGGEPYLLSDCTRFHTVDLAWSTSEEADYTVITSWAQTKTNQLILLDMIRGRFEPPDIIPQLRVAYERWGGVLYVEHQPRLPTIIQEAQRTGLPIQTVKADKSKEARADLAAARMASHNIWFPPASVPWYRVIEEELLAFPAGRHDDIVDTVAYAAIRGAQRSVYETRGIASI